MIRSQQIKKIHFKEAQSDFDNTRRINLAVLKKMLLKGRIEVLQQFNPILFKGKIKISEKKTRELIFLIV